MWCGVWCGVVWWGVVWCGGVGCGVVVCVVCCVGCGLVGKFYHVEISIFRDEKSGLQELKCVRHQTARVNRP